MKDKILKIMMLLVAPLCVLFCFSGCASMRTSLSSNADQIAQEFFVSLKKSDSQAAHDLFSKQLAMQVSQEKFDEFIDNIQSNWGKIEDFETAMMPFHQRIGEEAFLPLDVESIKKYTYEVKFQNSSINCDLTIAKENDEYRIFWFSFWGSGSVANNEINERTEELYLNKTKN